MDHFMWYRLLSVPTDDRLVFYLFYEYVEILRAMKTRETVTAQYRTLNDSTRWK